LIEAIGLSNVSVAHLRRARTMTPIACVQNLFQITNRASQTVLEECMRQDIAFVPFGSLGFGMSGPKAVLQQRGIAEEAARLRVTPAQLILAWTLALAPNILLIPGTTSVEHLVENLAAAEVRIDAQAMDRLSAL
jgi:aryl-alcohol dehydrogenase-like predicted oxidoreductase